MTSEDFVAVDDVKEVVYLPRSAVRSFKSPDALRRWLLSCLERGHYIRTLRISSRGVVLADMAGADVAPDPAVAAAGAYRRGGKAPKKERAPRSKAEKKKKQARERSARYRQRRKENKTP